MCVCVCVCVCVFSCVREISFALIINSVAELLTCLVAASAINHITVSFFFSISFFLLMVGCLVVGFTSRYGLVVLALALAGMAVGCLQVFPFSLTGKYFWKGNDVGLSMMSMNMLFSLSMVISVGLWQLMDNHALAFLGSGLALLAAITCFTIDMPTSRPHRSILV